MDTAVRRAGGTRGGTHDGREQACRSCYLEQVSGGTDVQMKGGAWSTVLIDMDAYGEERFGIYGYLAVRGIY